MASGDDSSFDSLTPRERNVLDLVRHGLTNEEIAARLGISLDGAKYHVSQILSKLGVASREEAAALAVPRERGWLRKLVPLGLFGKLAGTAVVAAALAGLGALAWGVLVSDGDDALPVDVSGLAVEDVYGLLEEAASREGSILYSEIEFLTVDESGKEDPFYAFFIWANLSDDVTRLEFQLAPTRDSYDLVEEGVSIVVGDYVYGPDDPGEALRHDYQGFCPGIENSSVSVLLMCNWWQPLNTKSEAGPVVGYGVFEGTPAITLIFREAGT
ncbi:MAG: helix-turn-helix transcriptional regulator, partial [Chloroflexi bacterium]|nr:helix-turn-helix transcriptional regulator [Chloroflexota bacterium]